LLLQKNLHFGKSEGPLTADVKEPQAEGNANSRLDSRGRSHKQQLNKSEVFLKAIFAFNMIKLDHRRSAAKTLVSKVRLKT